MLSQSLKALAASLRKFTDTGVVINGAAMTKICAVLDEAIDDAEQLEARAIPMIDQQIEDLPQNVTRLTPRLAERRAHVRSCPPCSPTPGPEGAA